MGEKQILREKETTTSEGAGDVGILEVNEDVPLRDLPGDGVRHWPKLSSSLLRFPECSGTTPSAKIPVQPRRFSRRRREPSVPPTFVFFSSCVKTSACVFALPGRSWRDDARNEPSSDGSSIESPSRSSFDLGKALPHCSSPRETRFRGLLFRTAANRTGVRARFYLVPKQWTALRRSSRNCDSGEEERWYFVRHDRTSLGCKSLKAKRSLPCGFPRIPPQPFLSVCFCHAPDAARFVYVSARVSLNRISFKRERRYVKRRKYVPLLNRSTWRGSAVRAVERKLSL